MFLLPGLASAQAYLNDEALGARLAEITEVAVAHLRRGVKPGVLLGSTTDANKFREAMTVFAVAAFENGDVASLRMCAHALEAGDGGGGELEPRALEAISAEPGCSRYRSPPRTAA